MESAIYSGWVQHRRRAPREHRFRYQVFMIYLDLAELEQVLSISPLWSRHPWAPARFRREDFFGDPALGIDEAVRRRVAQECGERPDGPVRLLANWRYFGYNMNPISTYYCFDRTGSEVRWVLLDVHNTPWNERHSYVLDCRDGPATVQKGEFQKSFHVSPFMPMDQGYRWRSVTPADRLSVSLQNLQGGEVVFDAILSLRREEISSRALNRILIRYPLMTVKVITAIYWQAFRLWLKRVPIFTHPNRSVRADAGEKRQ
ncbi:DUF1365 domain-containing protein [Microbulbifer yueqingensis]|uniref:Chromosome partitioning protein ParA n=1 Tax=Microbulbifer yueqingensis TaxID=658219 RepID=A0A1G8ZAW4_9GAMM|nr:DUF1365 domain-containing protein [Microbulbifer yueqingensis]SDK12133.1 hypothetical protein SAMN05216212_1542 [Microbulbifer yueqingensis]